MWHLLVCSPKLMFFVTFYVLDIVAVLIYATLTRDCEPRRNDSQLPPPVDFQVFVSPDPRWSYVESGRRFLRVPRSCHVGTDHRLCTVHHWCSTVYAKMLAEASEKIRL